MEEHDEEEDRISQLPDPILQHILSFLDTHEALQTSSLSSRWRHLSLSLPHLRFDLRPLAAFHRLNLNTSRTSAQSFSHQFSLSVSHFLSRRDSSAAVRSLHLSLHTRLAHAPAPAAFLEHCALYAAAHGAETLHLNALCHPPLRLPASATLRELKLKHHHYGIYTPKPLSLPNLKTLHLDNSMFIDDGDAYDGDTFDGDAFTFPKEPFSGFPELEELTLRRCWIYHELVIAAPKLRVLEIIQDQMFCAVMQEINAPLLTSFRYEGYYPLESSKIDLPLLEEVSLSIFKKLGSNRNRRVVAHEKRIPFKCVRLLQQLRNATIVALTLDTLKVLEMDRDLIKQSPSPFPYMKHLKLKKGRRKIPTVLERVIKYLKGGSFYNDSLKVEFPEGVCVVEENSDFDQHNDELLLERLFAIDDETPSRILNLDVSEELLVPKFEQDGRVRF